MAVRNILYCSALIYNPIKIEFEASVSKNNKSALLKLL
jgi:hypothetical protein